MSKKTEHLVELHMQVNAMVHFRPPTQRMPWLLESTGDCSSNNEEATQMTIHTQNSKSPNTLVPPLAVLTTFTPTVSTRGKLALY